MIEQTARCDAVAVAALADRCVLAVVFVVADLLPVVCVEPLRLVSVVVPLLPLPNFEIDSLLAELAVVSPLVDFVPVDSLCAAAFCSDDDAAELLALDELLLSAFFCVVV